MAVSHVIQKRVHLFHNDKIKFLNMYQVNYARYAFPVSTDKVVFSINHTLIALQ